MLVTVTVTQAMIDTDSHKCSKCPVAMAILAATGLPRVEVDNTTIALFATSHPACDATIVPTPSEVADWIYHYDAGKRVEPITFNLDVPTFA